MSASIQYCRSDVIIYAVNSTTRQLMVRNVTTIAYINNLIRTTYRSLALTAKILRAEVYIVFVSSEFV